MEDAADLEALMELYKNLPLAPSSTYYTIIEEEIPDLMNECEFEDVETSLRQLAPLVSYYRSHSSTSDSDLSLQSENADVLASTPSYSQAPCNLSSADCIQKSILYADTPRKTFHGPEKLDFSFANLPIIYSATASSETNDGSILEDEPADGSCTTYPIIHSSPEDDGDNRTRGEVRMDEVESSRHIVRNTKNVYQYFQNCLEASQGIEQPAESPKHEDVIDKVINSYHNLSSRKIDLSDDSFGASSTGGCRSLRSNAQPSSSSSCESSVDSVYISSQSSGSNQLHSSSLSSVRPNSEVELSDSFCERFGCLTLSEPLSEIILEPPDMFKSAEEPGVDFDGSITQGESILELYDVHLTPNSKQKSEEDFNSSLGMTSFCDLPESAEKSLQCSSLENVSSVSTLIEVYSLTTEDTNSLSVDNAMYSSAQRVELATSDRVEDEAGLDGCEQDGVTSVQVAVSDMNPSPLSRCDPKNDAENGKPSPSRSFDNIISSPECDSNASDEMITSFRCSETLHENKSPGDNVVENVANDSFQSYECTDWKNVFSPAKSSTNHTRDDGEMVTDQVALMSNGWIPWKTEPEYASAAPLVDDDGAEEARSEYAVNISAELTSDVSHGEGSVRKSASISSLEPIAPVLFEERKMKLFNLAQHVRWHNRCADELSEFALRRLGGSETDRVNSAQKLSSALGEYSAYDDDDDDEEGSATSPIQAACKGWLTEVLVANSARLPLATNETSVLAADDLLRGGPVFHLAECWRWKISNGTRSHLRIWRRRRSHPTFTVAETMRSLNSSKLDSTGCVTPEFCVVQARDCRTCDYIFAAPYDEHLSVVRNLIFGAVASSGERFSSADVVATVDRSSSSSPPSHNSLCVSNIEAIREFSDYFRKSLRTDSELRKGIPDLSLDKDLNECVVVVGSNDDHHQLSEYDVDEAHQVESYYVTSSAASSPAPSSDEESVSEMKNKKKSIPASTAAAEEMCVAESDESASRTSGILKSALKRGSKKFHKKKHRVQFDESLNKFFEADYVILVRDEEYEDDYGRCECGNQFCYEGCYYEDEDEDDYEPALAVDSPRYDFAAAFDPPIDFVDPVTLSPPDGYKDGCCPQPVFRGPAVPSTDNEVRGGVAGNRDKLRNESASREVATACPDTSKSQERTAKNSEKHGEKKNVQVQGYPFHANDVNPSGQLGVINEANVSANGQSRYIVETITMTTVTERRIVHESSNDPAEVTDMLPDKYNNNNGILKGGKLWRNKENDTVANAKQNPLNKVSASAAAAKVDIVEDEKRGVKFRPDEFAEDENCCDGNENQDLGAFTLTFKLGNRVVPCNSLKPNSAVRQLFPDPRFVNPPAAVSEVDCDENLGKCEGKYLITEESLRAFNEVNKRSVFATFKGKERYPYKDSSFTIHSDDEDMPQNDLLRKTIERNTLRRSLMRYPKGQKRGKKKCEVSLEERIKQLCVDDEVDHENVAEQSERIQPLGEEDKNNKEMSGYKKFSELFRRTDAQPTIDQHYPYYQTVYQSAQPDLAVEAKLVKKPTSNEARKQFLSSLTPLTACVSGQSSESNYSTRDSLKLRLPGDRHSIVSNASTGTDYSLGDIDDALCKPHGGQTPQPDVVANTPNVDSSTNDELAMFVQQDASRIERIKKRYNTTASAANDDDEDDEHDDYGFSRRPSVRGIKSQFGSTTKILQQIQAQLQPPLLTCPTKSGSHMTWPYYSTEVATDAKNSGAISPRNPALPMVAEENTAAEYATKVVWEKGATLAPRALPHPLKVDTACNNVHMLRLTPTDSMSEVTVPFKCDGARFPVANNIFQMKLSPVSTATGQVRLQDSQLAAHPIPVGTTSVIRMGHGQQQTFRVPCPVSGPVQVHLLATHHYENPQIRSSQPLHFPSQIVVAKGTQTSSISTTSFYQLQTQSGQPPLTKANTTTTTTEQAKLIQVNYTSAYPPPTLPSLNASPTRVNPQAHLMKRGAPEGAVSSSLASAQDCVRPMASSLVESGANPQQSQPGSTLMYGMKV